MGSYKHFLVLFALCFATFVSAYVDPAPECTEEISEKTCRLPNCRCSGTEIPGALKPEETPQLVFLTYDDAVTITNFPFYKDELTYRKNPNGHPISATFFVSHEYTDYSMVHELWQDGHDIALHSISHNTTVDYWKSLNASGWELEFTDQRKQLSQFANIPEADVQGARAPLLQIGGDEMYKGLYDGGFKWENSRPTLYYRNPGLWPYTNDYETLQECKIVPCPIGQYPGFWTVPMIDMYSSENVECSMADACVPYPTTRDETFQLLQTNFLDHYNGNRAPFELAIHAGWVNGTGSEEILERRIGYSNFLDYLATLDDTYVVSVTRGLEWVQNPTAISSIKEFKPFHTIERPNPCNKISCRFTDPWERYMTSCISCPRNYPWVGNPLGQ